MRENKSERNMRGEICTQYDTEQILTRYERERKSAHLMSHNKSENSMRQQICTRYDTEQN